MLSGVIARKLLKFCRVFCRKLFRGKVDDNGKLQVNIMPSRPQPSGYDCGVYTAAYAIETL